MRHYVTFVLQSIINIIQQLNQIFNPISPFFLEGGGGGRVGWLVVLGVQKYEFCIAIRGEPDCATKLHAKI